MDNSVVVDSVFNIVLNISVIKVSDSEFNEFFESYFINIIVYVMVKINGVNN